MTLIKNGQRVQDTWTAVDDDQPLPDGPTLISFDRWRAQDERLRGRNGRLGLKMRAEHSVRDIAEDLDRFDLIALEFPTFRDGRAFTSARLLRERYGFKGEVRAIGNVMRDQFRFMARCGFDALEVEKDSDADAWATAINEVRTAYQPAADDKPPIWQVRRRQEVGSWAY